MFSIVGQGHHHHGQVWHQELENLHVEVVWISVHIKVTQRVDLDGVDGYETERCHRDDGGVEAGQGLGLGLVAVSLVAWFCLFLEHLDPDLDVNNDCKANNFGQAVGSSWQVDYRGHVQVSAGIVVDWFSVILEPIF